MPWTETNREMERVKFIAALASEDEDFSALCRRFNISRQTGYTWKRRFEEEGAAGLSDRRSVAVRHPNMTDGAVEDAVVALRKQHPTWGPKKLRAWLQEHRSGLVLPAPSTIGDILTRRGVTAARKRRLRVPPSPVHLTQATCPNAIWTTDHKGSFRLSEGRCYPLTLMDAWSRYFLKCEALSSTSEEAAWPHYEAAFREFGLPARIRSDNGVPFANANTPGRLSKLSVWWVKLGIELERIEPGHPEQNGQHERMHRTLEEAIDAGKHDLTEQQRRFDAFRREWNHERPHEALGQRCPARIYETSWRPYPAVVRPPEYEPGVHVRTVYPVGTVCWRGQVFSVGKVLAGERVGFQELDDGRWVVRFGPVRLCTVEIKGAELKVGMKPKDLTTTPSLCGQTVAEAVPGEPETVGQSEATPTSPSFAPTDAPSSPARADNKPCPKRTWS